MTEFNNRIAAQRRILQLVNQASGLDEELFGLSSGAIRRWATANRIADGDALHELLTKAAAKLFFLSNKSQEQITEDYQAISAEVKVLTDQIGAHIVGLRRGRIT